MRFLQINATNADYENLLEVAGRVTTKPNQAPDEFVDQVAELTKDLTFSFQDAINRFTTDPKLEVIQISGLPGSASEKTPLSRNPNYQKENVISDTVIIAILKLIGEPFCFQEENYGHLTPHIFPIKAHQSLQISSNSAELTTHTDGGFHPSAPYYTSLFCLRHQKDQDVFTYISSMQQLLDVLSEEEIDLLKQKRFLIEQELSYGGEKVKRIALYQEKDGDNEFRFDIPLVSGTDEESQLLVDKMKDILLSSAHNFNIQEGDFLVMKNLKCVHGRTSYTPRYDGTDRWLQRTFATKNLDSLVGRIGHRLVTVNID